LFVLKVANRIKLGLILCLILTVSTGYSQELSSDSYSSEFIWGVNKNTAGGLIGGFVLRKSMRINDRLYESYGLELMNVKHPLESQYRSRLSGNSFILGKTSYLYAIRLQYGRELILFRKAPQQGVEIKAIGAVGPSIGLQAPYYIEYIRDGGSDTFREQYDPNKHDALNCSRNCIIGTGYLLQGLHESQLKVGANVKLALSFELGTSKSNVTGFEAGFLLDAYASDIELMPTAENKNVFPTAFVTMFYGSRR